MEEIFQAVFESSTSAKCLNLSMVFQKGPLDIVFGTYFHITIPGTVGTSFFDSPIIFIKEEALDTMSPSVVFHNLGRLRHSLDDFHLPQLSIPLSLVKGQLRSFGIEVIEHVDLNLKRSPCVEDPTYDISLCLDRSLSRRVGCKIPWGKRSSQLLEQDCKTSDEFTRLLKMQEQYRDWATQKVTINRHLPKNTRDKKQHYISIPFPDH